MGFASALRIVIISHLSLIHVTWVVRTWCYLAHLLGVVVVSWRGSHKGDIVHIGHKLIVDWERRIDVGPQLSPCPPHSRCADLSDLAKFSCDHT